MADSTISGLTDGAASKSRADLAAIVQGGVTKKITLGDLLNLLVLDKSAADIATSGAGEEDLRSYAMPANTMGATGVLRVTAWGSKAGAGGNKTLKFYFGANSVTFHVAANNTNDWRLDVTIMNVTTASQKISWIGLDGTTHLMTSTTLAIDTTGIVTMKITGECVNAGDTITQRGWLVEQLYKG